MKSGETRRAGRLGDEASRPIGSKTRRSANVYYEEVLAKLQEGGVRFLVVGAMAMNLHGVPRMTADLDLLADLSPQNLSVFLRALETLGYKPRLPVPATALLDPERRRQWIEERNLTAFTFVHTLRPWEEIDLLLASPVSFETAEPDRKVLAVGRLRIPVISLDHLIEMKRRAGRAQDAADLDALERLKRLLEGP